MPRKVSEVTSGTQFSRSLEDGIVADSQNRVFRVLLNYPNELIDIQGVCGIYIGNQHPVNGNIFCSSFDAKYDGDSRLVLICTFNYRSQAAASQQDPQQSEPTVRPANWSTSVATYESPVRTWHKVTNGTPESSPSSAANALADLYDGATRLEPLITISVEQYEAFDPLRNSQYVGCINLKPAMFGTSLTCERATILLRSIQSAPVVESWGNLIYRGWKATYEFLHKRNPTYIYNGTTLAQEDIGWDIAMPQTGFNVKSFNPNAAPADADIYAQPLRHSAGKIVGPPFLLPANVAADEKVRAMIKVFEYENGGASQTPSAQPIPLNDDGTPRVYTANPPVLVYRYRVYKEADFGNLGLRLF